MAWSLSGSELAKDTGAMRMTAILPALLLVSGCDGPPAAPSAPAAGTAPSASDTATATTATSLAPLRAQQIAAADLGGELGCTFAVPGDAGPLLIATGAVADTAGRAQALGASSTEPVRLQAQETGGFDAMLDGVVFTQGAQSYAVALVDGVPSETGGESPPLPARLDVTMPGRPSVAIIGEWTCGP